MKSIVLTFVVLVAFAAATPFKSRSHPRPENDPSYLYSQDDKSRERLSPSLRNSGYRIPPALQDRVSNAAEILSMTPDILEKKNAAEVMNSINDVCNAAISTDSIKPTFAPSKQEINMRLMTSEGETAMSLSQPQRLVELPAFRDDKDVVIFISGWKMSTSQEDNALAKMKEAYQCRGNINLIVIDLGRQIDNLQSWLSLDNEQVGKWVAEVISELTKRVSVNRIHLIGHGVGAHVAGAAGRHYNEMNGKILPRITALDPAMLCYKESQTLPGLQKGDAEFVDVIHTSAYGLGKQEPLGDVDFFPNGPSILQPGTRDLITAHNRAVEYFAESVIPGNEENFLGQMCNSMKNLQNKVCQQKQINMGLDTPTDARGNYFLQTKSVSPYGNKSKPGSSKNTHCRRN